ncbi:MAG: radical SAM protein [Clostridia bacterium]|nr:radical SAM protein [Clostridia bacterium]
MSKVGIKSRDMGRLAEYREYLRRHPRLTYLFAELTDRCNLACLHCGSSCGGGEGRLLDTKLLLRTLGEVAEDFEPRTVMICLTGGEPLLHPDFFEIAKRIHDFGFPWGITTNGTLIDLPVAERMAALGLESVTLSLDGLEGTHDALRRVKGSFRKVLKAVECLHAAGISVQITSVIHSGNYHELEPLFDLMCEMRVESWRVINIEPIGRALAHPELLLSDERMLGLLDFIREKRYDAGTPMDVCFGCSHYLSYEYERELRDNYFICGSGLYVASILCNGDIYSCLDIERRPELIQGNIARDRFSDVWRDGFREFRSDRTMLCGKCRNCAEREFCAGDSTHTWDFDNNQPRFCIASVKRNMRKENSQ